MSNNDNKLISLEHLGIVKQYIDTKCGDLGNDLYTTSNNVEQNTQDIASIKNEIADLNLGGGGAMSSIELLEFQVKRIEDADVNSDFNGLGIGKRFISLESGIDGLDTRISNLENKSSTDSGVVENANIDANTLINMINSDDVMNGILTKNSKFGSSIISFISDNGTINASKIVGNLPTSMLNGTIPTSMLTGTINEDTIPSIPFSKIQSDTVGIKLNADKAIESNNTIWKLNGDGSGQITNEFTWDKDGKLTIGNNLISWSHLTDESIPESLLNRILDELGNGEESLDMKNLLNNYFGKSIGYRVDANNANIINDKDEYVITTITDLLGDKIGVLEYNADNKVKTTTDANGNVMPVVTTVSNVIGDVTGAKAKYDSNNKLTDIEYDKDISVAAKFEEIEKNWIGKSFKPEFEVKTINSVSAASQTTQSVADVFNEIKTDWIGEGLKPVYIETNGVKSRKTQNIEDVLNELKTKWIGEVNDETNGNSIKLGVVRNEDGTIASETSVAKVFNEMQVDWIGKEFRPSHENLIRTSQTVYDVIKEIKQEWLGNLFNANTSVSSKITECLDNIAINAKSIKDNKTIYDKHINEYSTFSASVNTKFGTYDVRLDQMNDKIIDIASLAAGTITIDNVASIVNAAINDGKLDIYTRTAADKQFATNLRLDDYIDLADKKYETKENVENALKDYLKTNDVNTLNSMLNSAPITTSGWYESIKNAILDIADGRYATSATSDALSSYLTKTDASNTYLAKTEASNTYLAKLDINPSITASGDNIIISVGGKTSNTITIPFATQATYATSDASGNVITSTYLTIDDAAYTYVKQSDYDDLLDKYDTLKSEYENLVSRVAALEAK